MLTAKLEAKKENDKDRVYKVYIYIYSTQKNYQIKM